MSCTVTTSLSYPYRVTTNPRDVILNGKGTSLGLEYVTSFSMSFTSTPWVGLGVVSSQYIALASDDTYTLTVNVTGTNSQHCGRIYINKQGTCYWDPSSPGVDSIRYAPYSVTNEEVPLRYRNGDSMTALPAGEYKVGFVIFNGNGTPQTSHEEREDGIYLYCKNTLFSQTPNTATIQRISIPSDTEIVW